MGPSLRKTGLPAVLCLYSIMAPTLAAAIVTATPELHLVGDIRFDLGPVIPSGQTPEGLFVYVPILGGTFNTTSSGAKTGDDNDDAAFQPLKARVLPGGNDYAAIRPDGSISLSVNVGIQAIQSERPPSSSSADASTTETTTEAGSSEPAPQPTSILQPNDSTPAFFHYTATGYCEPNVSYEGTRTTRYGELDAWHVSRVSTNSVEHDWLNHALLVGQERLVLVEGQIVAVEIRLWKVNVKV